MARWQTERAVPAFTLMSGDVWSDASPAPYDLAIVGTASGDELSAMVGELDKSGRPMIILCTDSASAQAVRESQPRALVLTQYEGWLDAVVLVGCEVLRRVEAVSRARTAEHN